MVSNLGGQVVRIATVLELDGEKQLREKLVVLPTHFQKMLDEDVSSGREAVLVGCLGSSSSLVAVVGLGRLAST